jgi:integrase
LEAGRHQFEPALSRRFHQIGEHIVAGYESLISLKGLDPSAIHVRCAAVHLRLTPLIASSKPLASGAKLPFRVHAHMLRHACGYAMANAGHDTRLIQDWLGHRAIQHTARYTELSPTRFKDVWR